MQIEDPQAEASSAPLDPEAPRGRLAGLVAEVKSRPFAYIVLGLFLLIGPIAAPLLFPQAPPAAAAVGGLAFGVYAALCAVPGKFL